MKGNDRFLMGIVVGVVLLVIISFAVVLWEPLPSYRPDDTPEGVVHNYLLALQRQDYERAYSYLSPDLIHYPVDLAEFREDVEEWPWVLGLDDDVTLVVEPARILGDHQAVVKVQETIFISNGLFDTNQYTRPFSVLLERRGSQPRPEGSESDSWLIIAAESYLLYCWTQKEGCDE